MKKGENKDGLIEYKLSSKDYKRLTAMRYQHGIWLGDGSQHEVWLNIFAETQGYARAVDLLADNEEQGGKLIRFGYIKRRRNPYEYE